MYVLVDFLLIGCSEGQDWFGVDLRLGQSCAPIDWEVYSSRRRVTDALSEWQGLVDPATGELYYMSHISSASLWEKRNETLRAESELRRLVVPWLDAEFRGEVRVFAMWCCRISSNQQATAMNSQER